MRKFRSIAIMSILALCCNAQNVSAQSFLDKLGSTLSSLSGKQENSTVSKITDIASQLLGTGAVNANSLQGTWSYEKPCIAFESENVLASLGGVAASTKLENSLNNILNKVGFSSGKIDLTLNADSTGCITLGGKNTEFKWSIKESDLALTFPLTQKTVQMNAKISGGNLRLAMNADKLLTIINTVSEKASSINSTASSINAMIKNVKGMYVGLKFTKKTKSKE